MTPPSLLSLLSAPVLDPVHSENSGDVASVWNGDGDRDEERQRRYGLQGPQ